MELSYEEGRWGIRARRHSPLQEGSVSIQANRGSREYTRTQSYSLTQEAARDGQQCVNVILNV